MGIWVVGRQKDEKTGKWIGREWAHLRFSGQLGKRTEGFKECFCVVDGQGLSAAGWAWTRMESVRST